MLQHELLFDRGVLIARPRGPLSRKDFSALAADADAYIAAHGALRGLVICAERFPGWEGLDGFVAHFEFVRGHHREIERVAFVSDSDLLALLPRLASHFVSAEVRRFKAGEEKDAVAWAGGWRRGVTSAVPRKRTFRSAIIMSAMAQKRSYETEH